MSTRPPANEPTDLRPLAGLLWLLGGMLLAVAIGLMNGAAAGLLALGIWCLVTTVMMRVDG